MERESFEDEDVARALNKDFIAIKVDREERPDIDHIYMNVCQALTGSGGWPLTIIMTPDKKPFFAGTYFPKKSRMGQTGLLHILEQIARAWEDDKEALLESAEKIIAHVLTDTQTKHEGELSIETAHQAFSYLVKNFDQVYGGFSPAPKFPTPHNIYFLLRYWKTTKSLDALKLAEKTLDSMYQGGIYDHIGYGFSRYATDRKWLVPHFEKMLYDNALLAIAYLEAYQATNNKKYSKTASEIFEYILRDMTSKEGIQFCLYYDITKYGNFEEGKNIPNLISNRLCRKGYRIGRH